MDDPALLFIPDDDAGFLFEEGEAELLFGEEGDELVFEMQEGVPGPPGRPEWATVEW